MPTTIASSFASTAKSFVHEVKTSAGNILQQEPNCSFVKTACWSIVAIYGVSICGTRIEECTKRFDPNRRSHRFVLLLQATLGFMCLHAVHAAVSVWLAIVKQNVARYNLGP